MELFEFDATVNILPLDGIVNYLGIILEPASAQNYFEKILETVPFKNDEVVIFGKRIVTKRKVAWYGDSNFAYTYSNTTKQALGWTKELLELKNTIEEKTQSTFNTCLINLYHDGNEGMGWHSDNEKTIKKDSCIASLTFGAERKFLLKHKKTNQTVSIPLQNGSLLAMKGATQSNWLHSIPKTTKVNKPRINLTFRLMI